MPLPSASTNPYPPPTERSVCTVVAHAVAVRVRQIPRLRRIAPCKREYDARPCLLSPQTRMRRVLLEACSAEDAPRPRFRCDRHRRHGKRHRQGSAQRQKGDFLALHNRSPSVAFRLHIQHVRRRRFLSTILKKSKLLRDARRRTRKRPIGITKTRGEAQRLAPSSGKHAADPAARQASRTCAYPPGSSRPSRGGGIDVVSLRRNGLAVDLHAATVDEATSLACTLSHACVMEELGQIHLALVVRGSDRPRTRGCRRECRGS